MISQARPARLAIMLLLGSAACTPDRGPSAIIGVEPAVQVPLVTGSAGRRDERIDVHAVNVGLQSVVLGSVVVDRYSFHVHGRPGEMKGRFRLYQRRIVEGLEVAVVIASGEMECATVAGNRARAGGRITWTSFPEGLPVGEELTWSVTDNGRGRRGGDTASQPLGNQAQAYCALGAPYPEQPVSRGQVLIKG